MHAGHIGGSSTPTISGVASRSVSRARLAARSLSRAGSSRSVLLSQDSHEFVNPDAHIGLETASLLHQFVSPHDPTDEELSGESGEQESNSETLEDRRRALHSLPWYKRPSPWWIMGMTPLVALAVSSTIAPRVQLYTQLVCQSYRPEYSSQHSNFTPVNTPGGEPVSVYKSNISSTDIPALPSEWVSFPGVIGPGIMGWMPPKISEPSPRCTTDPEVQAAVAQLVASLTTSMGILSLLTTAFWGQLSDRYGRRLTMGLAVFGTLVSDVNFILVSYFSDKLPGGYRFLLVGPIFDGLLGGMTTAIAAHHAYMADCVESYARARIFSLGTGIFFIGMGVGPTIGGLIIRATSDLLSVFYISTLVHLLSALLVWFLLPESLSKASMLEARRKKKEMNMVYTPVYKKLLGFLTPLGLLIPKTIFIEQGDGITSMLRDWNLTFVAMCTGFLAMLMSSYQYKFQYASAQFGWNSEQLGYWLSTIGAVRAIFLMVILPLLIKYFKPKPPPIQLPISPDDETDTDSSLSLDHRSNLFDLRLARASLGIELIVYVLLIFTRSSTAWTVATAFGALGGGFAPAMQSVALELYFKRGETETGKLFGTLSVVQTLCSQIVGPILFGLTYMSTVAVFPQALFVLCAAAISFSLLCTLLINLRPAQAKVSPTEIIINIQTETFSDGPN